MDIDIVRKIRDGMLAATDRFMIIDWPMTSEERSEWISYRQQLRDITKLESFSIENDFWPIPPRRYQMVDGSCINLPINFKDKYL